MRKQITPQKPDIPAWRIEQTIFIVRGQKVILDVDLATLYKVETKNLVRAVKRNLDRFPADFMFQLTKEEFKNLRFQFGTSSLWGGRRYLPYVFTEQGVAMLSSVLRSKRAVMVNVEIMRAFVRLRRILAENASVANRLNELEKKYDVQFKLVFDVLRKLTVPPESRRRMGFQTEKEK